MGTLQETDSTTGQLTTPKVRITAEGGIAILMFCNEAAGVAKGDVVEAALGVNDRFRKCPVNTDFAIGIVYDAAIALGAQGWIVVAGIADVKWDAVGGAPVAGWWLGVSATTAGQALAQAASPGVAALHFREVGHAIRANVGTLIRAVVHFN